MQIIKYSESSLNSLADNVSRVLRSGGLVVLPTDTVYGLAVDATNLGAIEKINQFKSRPQGVGISFFVNSLEMAMRYAHISSKQRLLADKLLPGSFTVIFDSKQILPKSLESERHTVGVRFIKDELISQIIKLLDNPITATSSNQHGQNNISSINSFLTQTPKKKLDLIDLIIDAGSLPVKKPSTVVDWSEDKIKINRFSLPSQSVITKSESETKDLAKTLMLENISKFDGFPMIFSLIGDLGSGKTIFSKGIAKLVDLPHLKSPSYQIACEYKIDFMGKDLLNHWDLYFLRDEDEFNSLEIAKIKQNSSISLIEWGQKGLDSLIAELPHLRIVFESLSLNERRISFQIINQSFLLKT